MSKLPRIWGKLVIIKKAAKNILDVPFEELEWARVASLLDAEGCIRKNQACMDIRMNDEDLIRMCHRVTGVRNTVNSRQLPTGTTQWVLYITGKDQVTRCLKRMTLLW